MIYIDNFFLNKSNFFTAGVDCLKKSLLYIVFFKSHKDLNSLLLYPQHLDYSLINCCWRLSIARVLGCTYMSDKEICTFCFIYDIYNINLYHSSCGICTTYVLLTINNIHQQSHYSRVPNNRRGWNNRGGWTL